MTGCWIFRKYLWHNNIICLLSWAAVWNDWLVCCFSYMIINSEFLDCSSNKISYLKITWALGNSNRYFHYFLTCYRQNSVSINQTMISFVSWFSPEMWNTVVMGTGDCLATGLQYAECKHCGTLDLKVNNDYKV